MKISLFSKINRPLVVLCVLSVFAFGATKAYFTTQNSSSENIFLSGNLAIAVTQDSVLTVNNWKPTDIHSIEFQLSNTGSMPTYVKGYINGFWSDPNLEPGVFDILQVERKIGEDWIAITQDGLNLEEEFYLSADGTEATLLQLEPEQTAEFRITTQLKEETPDEYQNQSFSVSLHMTGKQVTNGSDWPAWY